MLFRSFSLESTLDTGTTAQLRLPVVHTPAPVESGTVETGKGETGKGAPVTPLASRQPAPARVVATNPQTMLQTIQQTSPRMRAS